MRGNKKGGQSIQFWKKNSYLRAHNDKFQNYSKVYNNLHIHIDIYIYIDRYTPKNNIPLSFLKITKVIRW